MKYFFIINPVSGKGKGKVPMRILRAVQYHFGEAGIDFVVRIWDRPSRISELLDEAFEMGVDVIVAVGGNGTINEIGKRLIGTKIALGVVPMGSGNGFARHLGISRNPKRAIQQLLDSHLVQMDTGDFGGITFLNAAGVGIDAEVAARFASAPTRGIKTYVRLATKTFMQFRAFDCRVVVDDEREYHFEKMLLIDITNGTQWGGGAKIMPMALVSDGWLEAIILKKTPLMRVPRLVRLLFEGKIHSHPDVKVIRGRKFEIYRPEAGHAHVDGEPVRLGETILAQIRAKSVTLLVPDRKEVV